MHRSRSFLSLTLPGALVAALVGCEPPAPDAPYPVTFESVSDPGAPLGGVLLRAAEQDLGTTDANGRLSIELAGREGAVVPVVATCPTGHRPATNIAPLVLRRTIDLTTGAPSTLRVSVTCPPELRHGVVVLRASGAGAREGIPVMVDGVEVARTDRSGVAHVALERAPGTTVSVMLATSSILPDVTPRDPAMPFTFHDADEIFLFDRPLEAPPPPERIRRGGGGPRPPVVETIRSGPCNLRTGAGC